MILPNPNTIRVTLPFLPKTLQLLPALLERMERVALRLLNSDSDSLGDLEEQLFQPLQDLGRAVLEEAAQKKADAAAFGCPVCEGPLTQKRTSSTTVPARFGSITLRRAGGGCRKCEDRFFPADEILGIQSGQSPFVREMAALFASKMPVAEAAPTLWRSTGIPLPRSTLGRVAAEVGEAALAKRTEVDQAVVRNQKAAAAPAREPATVPPPTQPGPARLGAETAQALRREAAAAVIPIPKGGPGVASLLPEPPFTLVIMIDAWNIRERGEDWGKAEAVRAGGKKPEWWRWVYAGTVFRLSDRVKKGGRPIILSRGFASTRGGMDALREQLHAEAIRHGLGRAARVLVVADGAVWIWNLVADRFPEAVQLLDLYHAKEHLWAVAAALHGQGTDQAKAWVKPLAEQVESGEPARVIEHLEELSTRLEGKTKEKVDETTQYFKNNADRMDYADATRRGEPCGSGAIESTCRQYQSRFKCTGQFWTKEGDEGLMCIQTFWRNGRWDELFPHAKNFNPANN